MSIKKIFCVLTALTCASIVFSSCGNKTPQVGDMRNAFPQTMAADKKMPEDMQNLITEFDESLFGADVNIYYSSSKYSRDYEYAILDKLGFEPDQAQSDDGESTFNRYKDGSKKLLIDKNDGTFSYDAKAYTLTPVTDIERLNTLGEEKLKELDLLPKNYRRSGYAMQGSKTDLYAEDGDINEYGPRFLQEIDGKEVVGSGIWICFNADEKLTEINSYWLDPVYAATAKTLSFEEAYAKIGGEDSYISTELNTPLTKVEFDTVNAVYYKNPEYDYYIPMFRFEGTAYSGDKSDVIWAYVIAIPDLTDDMIQK